MDMLMLSVNSWLNHGNLTSTITSAQSQSGLTVKSVSPTQVRSTSEYDKNKPVSKVTRNVKRQIRKKFIAVPGIK